MPLKIEVGESRKPYDPDHHDEDRAVRRVFCTGCQMGVTYTPEKWIFPREQVAAWIEEHRTHKAVA